MTVVWVGPSLTLFSWPHLAVKCSCLLIIVFNSVPQTDPIILGLLWKDSSWDKCLRFVVNPGGLFPAHSPVLTSKLSSLQLAFISNESTSLLLDAFYHYLHYFWECPWSWTPSHSIANKIISFRKRFETLCKACSPPQAKFLSHGSGAGGGDNGVLLFECFTPL